MTDPHRATVLFRVLPVLSAESIPAEVTSRHRPADKLVEQGYREVDDAVTRRVAQTSSNQGVPMGTADGCGPVQMRRDIADCVRPGTQGGHGGEVGTLLAGRSVDPHPEEAGVELCKGQRRGGLDIGGSDLVADSSAK